MEPIKPLIINQELKNFFDSWYLKNFNEYKFKNIQCNRDTAKLHKLTDIVDYNKDVIRITKEYINYIIEKSDNQFIYCNDIDNEELVKYNENYIKLLQLLPNRDYNIVNNMGHPAIYIPEISYYFALYSYKHINAFDYVIKYTKNTDEYIYNKLIEKLSEFMDSDEIEKYIKENSITKYINPKYNET